MYDGVKPYTDSGPHLLRVNVKGTCAMMLQRYYIYIPSASRTHKFVVFFSKTRFFLQLLKKVFSQKILFFSLLGKKPIFFSHLVSWHLMIRSLRRFKPLYWYQPWIYPSQYPSCWLCFHPAGFGSSHKKRPDALGKCRTALSVITVNLESLDDFFPRATPRSINWNMAGFFHWEKNDFGLPKSNKQSNKSIEQN